MTVCNLFLGDYIIVVAFMRETKLCDDIPVLSDYVQPLADGFDSGVVKETKMGNIFIGCSYPIYIYDILELTVLCFL